MRSYKSFDDSSRMPYVGDCAKDSFTLLDFVAKFSNYFGLCAIRLFCYCCS